ncbi:MAG: VanZ family protein [Nitriliruptor sp.]
MQSATIVEVVGFALVAGLAVAALSALVRAVRRGQHPVLGPAVLDGAIVASLVAVAIATLSPIGELGTRLDEASEINLRPLERMDGAPEIYAFINLLLLVPTIVLLAQRWRRAGMVRLAATGIAVSLGIELLQLVHPSRGTNVDDLLLNSAGAAVAAVLGVAVRRLAGPRPVRRGTERRPVEREPWVSSR